VFKLSYEAGAAGISPRQGGRGALDGTMMMGDHPQLYHPSRA